MTALKKLGLLTQNPTTRSYALGPHVLAWAGVYSANLDVRNAALPILENLRMVTRETISLYILEGDDRVCVERMESPQNVRIVTRVGKRLPLYAGSAGKVMLAFLPEERQEAILSSGQLNPLTEKTIVDPEALRSDLARIRQQGYAVSDGEWILDAAGVAAPIFDHNGEVIAGVSISGPSSRFSADLIEKYASRVTQAALQISKEMGYLPEVLSTIETR
jgi:DNA-binding IclR family transcriptional regulator